MYLWTSSPEIRHWSGFWPVGQSVFHWPHLDLSNRQRAYLLSVSEQKPVSWSRHQIEVPPCGYHCAEYLLPGKSSFPQGGGRDATPCCRYP